MQFLGVYCFALIFVCVECNLAKDFATEKLRGITTKIPPKISFPDFDLNFDYMDMNFKVKVKNIFVDGFKFLRLDKLDFDVMRQESKTSVSLPKFVFDADYGLQVSSDSGKFRRSGHLTFKMKRFAADLVLGVNLIPFDFTSLKFDLKSGEPEFSITGLFDNKALTKSINNAINAGIGVVLETGKKYLNPVIEFFLLPTLKAGLKRVFNN